MGNAKGQAGEAEMSGTTRLSILAIVAAQRCSRKASVMEYE